MKKYLCGVFVWFLALAMACTASPAAAAGHAAVQQDSDAAENVVQGVPAIVRDGSGTDGAMLDEQEQELRQALDGSETFSLRREGDLLAVSLRSDPVFDTANPTFVRSAYYRDLDRIARVLNQYPDTEIRVEGYTDSKGAASSNQVLSARRAAAIRDIFVLKCVLPARMQTQGCGESSPVASNDNEAGRKLNRRVEIKIQPSKKEGRTAAVWEPGR
ncbi:MAG: hypothetical protein A2521_16185 [Deltaproteobacteria bacterium RIFOXYD12_FULL_57_12]|nr:MAG: hypothetical protein A2521_16185 [Deltaproteobacteria bacterium RIFOXYD12_FULL_57_12]